jgi:hypothetical protein
MPPLAADYDKMGKTKVGGAVGATAKKGGANAVPVNAAVSAVWGLERKKGPRWT